MKKALLIWLIFITATTYSIYHLYYFRYEKEGAINQLIEREEKKFQREEKRAHNETLMIVIFTIILGIIVFFGINYIFRYYDRQKTKNIVTTFYTKEIEINFKRAMTSLVERPLKYFIYQSSTQPKALIKNTILNVIIASFNYLLLSFLRGFNKSGKRAGAIIKQSLCDVVHNRLFKEYSDTIYAIYQNQFLDVFQQYNKDIEHFCNCLEKRKVISSKKLQNIKDLLEVKIKQRKKLKNNYFILVGLFGTSIFLFTREENGFYKYLEDFSSRKYSFIKIVKALKRQHDIYCLKKELLNYSNYVDNLLEVRKALDYAFKKQTVYVIWMFMNRIYFSQNKTFVAFLIQIAFEAVRDFITEKASDLLFRADSVLKNFRENSMVNMLLNGGSSDDQSLLNSMMMDD